MTTRSSSIARDLTASRVSRRAALTGGALALATIGTLGATAVPAQAAPPGFQLPFPCGEKWQGQTRSNHSPAEAIDFNAENDRGRPVLASAAGTVSRVADEGATSYGKWVEVDHGGGWTTRYAHLDSQSVNQGQSVAAGAEIGKLGNTGGSTGPHLHYEQRQNGSPVRITFNGQQAHYWGTRTYTSNNSCGGGQPDPDPGTSQGTVTTESLPLNVRAEPSTDAAKVGSLQSGTVVNIHCHAYGTEVTGTYGTSTLWNRIGDGRWVPDAYVFTGSDGPVQEMCN